jgi:hypothetical protein
MTANAPAMAKTRRLAEGRLTGFPANARAWELFFIFLSFVIDSTIGADRSRSAR